MNRQSTEFLGQWNYSVWHCNCWYIPRWTCQNLWNPMGLPGGSDGNLPARQETQVRSLGWEDPLEKGMAVHSSILAWRIPWTEEPSELQSIGSQRVGHNWATNTHTYTHTHTHRTLMGLPWWLSGKESSSQCSRQKRHRSGCQMEKIPWSRKWQLASAFLSGKFLGQRSLVDYNPLG